MSSVKLLPSGREETIDASESLESRSDCPERCAVPGGRLLENSEVRAMSCSCAGARLAPRMVRILRFGALTFVQPWCKVNVCRLASGRTRRVHALGLNAGRHTKFVFPSPGPRPGIPVG